MKIRRSAVVVAAAATFWALGSGAASTAAHAAERPAGADVPAVSALTVADDLPSVDALAGPAEAPGDGVELPERPELPGNADALLGGLAADGTGQLPAQAMPMPSAPVGAADTEVPEQPDLGARSITGN